MSRCRMALVGAVLATTLAMNAARAQPSSKTPAPAANPLRESSQDGDLAYGAFQRGLYLTAFKEATRRVEEMGDPKAMTLLGELYADGLGIPNDDNKAAQWYNLAA